MNWLEKLRLRWGLQSLWQVIIILIIFALTGTTVMVLKKPVVEFFGTNESLVLTVLYYILILPIYNVFLLFYGFIFGQFSFFWEFEKKTWNRIASRFKRTKD